MDYVQIQGEMCKGLQMTRKRITDSDFLEKEEVHDACDGFFISKPGRVWHGHSAKMLKVLPDNNPTLTWWKWETVHGHQDLRQI